ncbi:polyphosphate polymerase domain-containing protein [Mesorhizobium sp. LHD-90]|uniref:polyphosphate polymerase domain-containing protein n=1 Tax=Mesorhizobium sp. LHD-90 TaxID=3071414 RepID=UPI0027DF096E|nr:polyphosphate polymerase domain-containing protein [Mesorhizobium sp. LHD-90]MDQ6437464.1 polyphosphate polymerase domain-containing protein [Mesorhizobium sp. LHD-90]
MFTKESSYPIGDSIMRAGHQSPVLLTAESGGEAATAVKIATGQPNMQPLFSLQAPHSTVPRWLIEPFHPVSLEQLDAKADMLDRRDNKYVVRADVLHQATSELVQQFDILEIDGKRDFTYDTCYFDDAERSAYFDHHKGRRIRCKVRMRKYVDAGLCFVEVKLKHMRGMTIKERLQRPVEMYGIMDDKARRFVESSYRDLYRREFDRELRPALEMRYQRVTLVAKHGGERVTIDTGIVFAGKSGSQMIDGRLILVEVKSGNANGIADKILRRLHQHPTNTCSKYCVAMAALNEVSKTNKFLVALRRLGVVPTSGGAWLAKPSRPVVGAMSEHRQLEAC